MAQVVVMIFGIIIGVLSAWGVYAPERLVTLVRGVMEQDFGIHVAVVARLLLGAALIIAATESRFPLVFQALGWIAILAAVALAFIGRERMRRFVAWFDRFPQALVRLWLLVGMAFGVFLIHGVT